MSIQLILVTFTFATLIIIPDSIAAPQFAIRKTDDNDQSERLILKSCSYFEL